MTVSNTWNNNAKITKAALKYIENNAVFMKHVNRGYDGEYKAEGGKAGNVANIRVPGYGTYRSGKVANPTGNNESYVPVTLTQGGADFQVSSAELTLNVDDLMTVLGPRISCVISEIDRQGLELMRQISNSVGTPGTAPTSIKPFSEAYAKLAKYGMPTDDNVSAILDYDTQASVADGLKGLLVPPQSIGDMYRTGSIGYAAGMKFSADNIVPTHTVGEFGTTTAPIVAATSTEGDATVNLSGFQSGQCSFKAGDVIQFAGVYAVNAVTKQSTGKLMDFVVTADTSDSSGSFATLPISPAIYASSTDPRKNVSALPAQNAVVTIFGTTAALSKNKISPINCVFHKDAFVLASADLAPVPGSTRMKSSKLDFSIRVSEFWDGRTDDHLHRLDVLFGWATLRAPFACRVQG